MGTEHRTGRDGASGTAAEKLKVLVVGQGSPATGGIPSFLALLTGSDALRQRVSLAVMNTARPEQRPGAASVSNATATIRDAARLRRRAAAADVVHLNVAPAPLLPALRALSLTIAARSAGAAVIVHAHSGRLHVAARRRSYRLVMRALIRAADAIAVVSGDGERVIRSLGGDPRVIRNGVDVARFAGARRSDPDRAAITFVGTVCERKGLDDLRIALRGLRDDGVVDASSTRVRIVGDARQEGPGVFERVRAAYERDGLDMVTFTGAVGPTEITSILSETDVFCLPSHWEGLPISVLEAMAAGTAVVATDVGEIPSLLADGAGVVVPRADPRRLASALRRLLADPGERSRLAAAAHERVVRDFDRAVTVEAVASLYHEVARAGRRRRGRAPRYSM